MFDAALYGLLDVALGVSPAVENPYDPDEVTVDVRLVSDGGDEVRWPAFWDGEAWRLRWRPPAEGGWHAVVEVDGVDAEAFDVEVVDEGLPGPLVVDGHGFRHVDGAAFVPVGLNLGWSAGGGAQDYARWFAAMSAEGGTFARVWFTHFSGQDPEWDDLGRMDLDDSAELDAILDAAHAEGVLVLPVLWQHSELEADNWSSWDENPYNAANGGPCADSLCFFEDEAARTLQRRLTRYAVARWGGHPALAGWEVMNELDLVEGVTGDVAAAWAADVAEDLRALEGDLHPITWSYALLPYLDTDQAWAGADYRQMHSYLYADVDPVVLGVAAAHAQGGDAVLVGEWGLDFLGDLDRADTAGLAWHNATWAALAAGSMGGALAWWWNDHIEPNDLWHVLRGPAVAVARVDLPALAPTEATLDEDDLEVYARAGDGEVLGWVHDPASTPPEASDERWEAVTLELPGVGPMDLAWLDPWTGEVLEEANTCGGAVEVPPFAGDLAFTGVAVDCAPGEEVVEADDGACGCGGGGPAGVVGIALAMGMARRRRGAG